MLPLVSLWGQMSVKSVTADHADPKHNRVQADPTMTLSLGKGAHRDGDDKESHRQKNTTV